MGCSNCTFEPEPFKSWGYLESPHPNWPCKHSYGNCRYCDSCSAWWHRPDMEEETDEGGIVRLDCPDCTSTTEAMEE